MINEAEALAIADKAAQTAGWGGINSAGYVAIRGTMDGKDVWHVEPRQLIIGYSLNFAVSCTDGTILFSRMRGPR